MSDLDHYVYRGARAQILMHEREMRRFVEVWKRAKAAEVQLPQSAKMDDDYKSLEHLLFHALRAARGYMTWMCEKLNLPDPQIDPPPPPEEIAAKADVYLEYLLKRWRLPLANVDEATMSRPSFKSRWDMDYSIDSMLEHALCHPLRHAFQLEELLAAQK